jgi:hypothetical protein
MRNTDSKLEPLIGHGMTHESPDLVVRLALGVKVGSTLATTHHQTSQGVLEDLLETEAICQHGSIIFGLTTSRWKG